LELSLKRHQPIICFRNIFFTKAPLSRNKSRAGALSAEFFPSLGSKKNAIRIEPRFAEIPAS